MLKDEAPKPQTGSVTRARRLRKDMSLPEVLLWQLLKARPEGLKFRRQHPSGELTLDFYCADARLAIEIDGQSHAFGDRPHRDERRDAWLKSQGIETLRIPASDVLGDCSTAADGIVQFARSRLPLYHPARAGRSPSPRQARGGFSG
ncbi:endonuclease domain-containing protein [Blastomonas fulva]|jgi:very-short-patch-repair endonuclease|uniref:endonuclease domain-containing protein n=1 Tax=Blastomonas fulva TaxID=1550728 RepID=UPI003D2A0A2C